MSSVHHGGLVSSIEEHDGRSLNDSVVNPHGNQHDAAHEDDDEDLLQGGRSVLHFDGLLEEKHPSANQVGVGELGEEINDQAQEDDNEPGPPPPMSPVRHLPQGPSYVQIGGQRGARKRGRVAPDEVFRSKSFTHLLERQEDEQQDPTRQLEGVSLENELVDHDGQQQPSGSLLLLLSATAAAVENRGGGSSSNSSSNSNSCLTSVEANPAAESTGLEDNRSDMETRVQLGGQGQASKRGGRIGPDENEHQDAMMMQAVYSQHSQRQEQQQQQHQQQDLRQLEGVSLGNELVDHHPQSLEEPSVTSAAIQGSSTSSEDVEANPGESTGLEENQSDMETLTQKLLEFTSNLRKEYGAKATKLALSSAQITALAKSSRYPPPFPPPPPPCSSVNPQLLETQHYDIAQQQQQQQQQQQDQQEQQHSIHPAGPAVKRRKRGGPHFVCKEEGCSKVDKGGGYCIKHGGGPRCKKVGCKNGARNVNSFCTSHGGGIRCNVPGCKKSAVLRTKGGLGDGRIEFCIRHGGGNRCNFENCVKAAIGRTNFCRFHGGGVLCSVDNCDKLAQGGGKCCEHGGRYKCSTPGCYKRRTATGYCAIHVKGDVVHPDPLHPDKSIGIGQLNHNIQQQMDQQLVVEPLDLE